VADTVTRRRSPGSAPGRASGVDGGFWELGGFTSSESTRALHLPLPVETAAAQFLRAAVPRLAEVLDDRLPRGHRVLRLHAAMHRLRGPFHRVVEEPAHFDVPPHVHDHAAHLRVRDDIAITGTPAERPVDHATYQGSVDLVVFAAIAPP